MKSVSETKLLTQEFGGKLPQATLALFLGETEMRARQLFLIAAFVFVSVVSAEYSTAQTPPALTGLRVVTLPYVYVPFAQSVTEIRQGQKDTVTGTCTFRINLKLQPGQLAAGQRLARIQRAYDPDTCQESVETGNVMSPALPSTSPDLDGSSGSLLPESELGLRSQKTK